MKYCVRKENLSKSTDPLELAEANTPKVFYLSDGTSEFYMAHKTMYYNKVNIHQPDNKDVIREVYDVVSNTKFIFNKNILGKYIETHMEDFVVFISCRYKRLFEWFVKYDYIEKEFYLYHNTSIQGYTKDEDSQESLLPNFDSLGDSYGKILPVIIEYPYVSSYVNGKKIYHVAFSNDYDCPICALPYNVWLNNDSDFLDAFTGDPKCLIKDKMNHNMADPNDTLIINFKNTGISFLNMIDDNDIKYVKHCNLIDGAVLSSMEYDRFQQIEVRRDTRYEYFIESGIHIPKIDEEFKKRRIFDRVNRAITEILDGNKWVIFIIMNILNTTINFSCRYLYCFKKLYYWAVDIEFNDECIKFYKYNRFIRDKSNYWVRDSEFTVLLYKDHMVFYDPRYHYSKKQTFPLDIRILNLYLTEHSGYREYVLTEIPTIDTYSHLDEKLKVEENDTVTISDKIYADKSNNKIDITSAVPDDDTARRYKILVEGFIPHYISELSDDNSLEKTIKQQLLMVSRNLSNKPERINEYGLHGIVTDTLKFLDGINNGKDYKANYTIDMVTKFILWSRTYKDITLFNDLILYSGSSPRKKTLEVLFSAEASLRANISANRRDLNKIIKRDFNNGTIPVVATTRYIYPNGNIYYKSSDTLDILIEYGVIDRSESLPITTISIVPQINKQDMIWFIGGDNGIVNNIINDNVMDLSNNSVKAYMVCDLRTDSIMKTYDKFLDLVFTVNCKYINDLNIQK